MSTEMRPESETFGLVNYIQGNKAEVNVKLTHQEEIFRSALVCKKNTNCEKMHWFHNNWYSGLVFEGFETAESSY